jgi:hypothetical protein
MNVNQREKRIKGIYRPYFFTGRLSELPTVLDALYLFTVIHGK